MVHVAFRETQSNLERPAPVNGPLKAIRAVEQ